MYGLFNYKSINIVPRLELDWNLKYIILVMAYY